MRLIVLCFALFSSPVFSSSILVGNAGEGVLQEHAVYLRDLYENGIHLTPYVGDSVHPNILKRLNLRTLESLDIDPSILAKKLTDINEKYAPLGEIIADALAFYTWTLVPFESFVAPFEERVVSPHHPFLMAVRYRDIIFVDKSYWNLVSQEHRVALVVHEVLSAFMNPLCTETLCTNRDLQVRGLTSTLFQPPQAKPPDFDQFLFDFVGISNSEKKQSLSQWEVRSFWFPTAQDYFQMGLFVFYNE